MHMIRSVSLGGSSRWPLALVVAFVGALWAGPPDIARAEDYHWNAPFGTERQGAMPTRKATPSVKSKVRKRPPANLKAKTRKAKPR